MTRYSRKKASISIRVNNISKTFKIFKNKRSRLKNIFGINKESNYIEKNAIRDLTMEIYKGETVGIVGVNGSGKSTLLQMICGTLKETSGSVQINGKVAAILELGSGFNMEFTGKENIYLNGILMGLTKKEIEGKMDRIIEFADIGEYINQPLRTYSSGMIVRLAFAIITEVEADILIIDEALAVGDALFTQKCMRFIQSFKKDGTILFVSHDTNAVLSLCDRAILLDQGVKIADDKTKEVIDIYISKLHEEMKNTKKLDTNKEQDVQETVEYNYQNGDEKISKWEDYRSEMRKNMNIVHEFKVLKNLEATSYKETTCKKAIINSVNIENIDEPKKEIRTIVGGEIVKLSIEGHIVNRIDNVIMGFILKNDKGLTLLGDNTYNAFTQTERIGASKREILVCDFIFTIPLLPPGDYTITVSIADGNLEVHEILDWRNDALVLQSQCNSVAAGLAGVPMHNIRMRRIKEENG